MLINGLIITAQKIMIQIKIQISNTFNIGQRYIGKKIIYKESMLRQLYTALAQYLRTINERVHDEILRWIKMLDIIPGTYLIFIKHIFVSHGFGSILIEMIINIITEHDPPHALLFPSH